MIYPPVETQTFEESLAELERVVRALEDGETSLEESLSRYEAGIRLLKRCYGQLSDAEQRIRLMNGVAEDGTPALQAFDHKATAHAGTPPAADPSLLPAASALAGKRRRRPTDASDLPF